MKKLKSCAMDAHYLGKVEIDGQTVILEPFPEMQALLDALILLDKTGQTPDAQTIKACFARIYTMSDIERKAWHSFLSSIVDFKEGKIEIE